jgi:hypothetical protein
MNPAALLLADPSPVLRRLVLRDLLQRAPGDPELLELAALYPTDPLAAGLLARQSPDGAWQPAALSDGWGAGPIQATALALMRLGYLGFGSDHLAVQAGAEYLFAHQRQDGSWALPGQAYQDDSSVGKATDAALPTQEPFDLGEGEAPRDGYAMMPLQTALPLRGLASCGYAGDPRAERAYDWLLAQRLPDGAWPTGLAKSGVLGYVAGYRRLAHSRWGCRSNTTGALLCLALHPERRSSPEARRALDLLLGRETREEYALGYEVARLLGAEHAHGFTTFYARFDLALLLELCARIGAGRADERVASLADFVKTLQGPFGLWEYARRPQAARWLTFDLLRSLSVLDNEVGDLLSTEPRTPFQPYPRRSKRF